MKHLNKFIILLIALGVSLWLLGVNEPFVGAYGANLNYFTLAAKNFQRFGYFKLHFLPSYYAGGDIWSKPVVYLHHPVLYFSLVSLPYLIFGFQNWVLSITPLIFSLFTVFWIYKITKHLFSEKEAVWSAVITAFFPLMTVFARQAIFEPAILSLFLGEYYFYLRFLKEKQLRFLVYFAIFSIISIFIDWGGAYFLIPFLILYPLFPRSREKRQTLGMILLTVILGIGVFLLQIILTKGSFTDLSTAVISRQNNQELFGLTNPLLRLTIVSFTRIVIYLTPLSFPAFIYTFSLFKKNPKSLSSLTFLFFLIFGLISIVVLPAATFGHIYFLFYLIPFFSLAIGVFIGRVLVKKRLLVITIICVIVYSGLVTYYKWQQIVKQRDKYYSAYAINELLLPYEEIAVLNFPGDVFEQYFFHPTKPLNNYLELVEWFDDNRNQKKAVFSCWSKCSPEDLEFINHLPFEKTKIGNVWLIDGSKLSDNFTLENSGNIDAQKDSDNNQLLLPFYRKLRDFIKVGQL